MCPSSPPGNIHFYHHLYLKAQRESFDMSSLKNNIARVDSDSDECLASSDSIEKLPLSVQRRVCALEYVHAKRLTISAAFRAELLELERKYHLLYEPLNVDVMP